MNWKIDVGIGTLRNEEETVRGWAKMMLFLCNEVYCAVDPDSSDNTFEILRSEFPKIHTIHQDRSLGDSDNSIIGSNRILIGHRNLEKLVNINVPLGKWMLLTAGDERIHPLDFHKLFGQFNEVKNQGFQDGITFPNFHHYTPDGSKCYDFQKLFNWGSLIQCRIQLKTGFWNKGSEPHSGMTIPDSMYYTDIPINHYCFMKRDRKMFDVWRDQDRFRNITTYNLSNNLRDWREMNMLNNEGEFK